MSEAAARAISDCVSRVRRRQRLLAFQDQLVAAIIAAGLLTALAILLSRAGTSLAVKAVWFAAAVLIILLILVAAGLRRRPTDESVALLIDSSMRLEDRLATAHQIVRQNRDTSGIEQALVADAAERIAPARPTLIVPYRMKLWYGLAVVSLAVLATIASRPQPPVAASEEQIARADIEEAGKQLEHSAEEIEKLAPVSTETARLAREQAEVGRSFRMSPASRAEALKRLSALEERIAGRQRALEQTKADEIVAIADSRFEGLLERPANRKPGSNTVDSSGTSSRASDLTEAGASEEEKAKSDPAKADRKEGPGVASNQQARPVKEAKDKDKSERGKATDQAPGSKDDRLPAPQQPGSDESKAPPARDAARDGVKPKEGTGANPETDATGTNSKSRNGAEKSARETANANGTRDRDSSKPADQPTGEGKTGGQPDNPEPRSEPNASSESGSPQQKEGDQGGARLSPPDAGSLPQPFGATPSLSEQLLKRALELKAGELSERDIKQLIEAAKALSKDLEKIAQSKELRESLEELARKVNPEQLEQVAREVAKNEDLKRELIAATRLMRENQKAKEAVAGLIDRSQWAKDEIDAGAEAQRGSQTSAELRNRGRSGGRDNLATGAPLTGTSVRDELSGKGKATIAKGKAGRGNGGEYLYVQSRLPSGAARVPYSNAYPQYRREAEQFVQRTTVPPAMRSMVRDYFDAINPNQK
jgi:hypothetical protein